MSKILTVFGATGNQGGSVIKAVLADAVLSKQFTIRGITRDVSKPAARKLADQGVQMTTADMSSPDAVAPAIQGSHTVFLVTNYWESMSAKVEFSQGKAVADACAAAGVQHLVFSSLINVSEASAGRLPHVEHFDAKNDVERYIRGTGVPATFVLPGFFMSNLFQSIAKQQDGESYAYSLPVSGDKARIPVFDAVGDMGLFVKAAIKHYPDQVGNQILAASQYISPNQLVADFSDVVGKPASFSQVPGDVYKSFLPPAVAEEMYENMLLLEDPGYYNGADLAPTLALLDREPTSWKDFVKANRARWE